MKVAALVCRLNAGQQPMPVQPSLYELRGVIRRSLLASRGDVLFNGPFDTDLFVIGGGSGRVRAARIASQHGARVTLAEEDRLGGTCVIRGCVPKKLMVYASKVGHEAKDSRGFGWTAPDSHFHWPLLRQNIHKELDRLENAYNRNLKKAGVTIARGRAAIRYKNTVVIANGATVRAESILIATGGVPYLGPQIPGIDHVITSNEVLWIAAMAKSNSDSGRRLYST